MTNLFRDAAQGRHYANEPYDSSEIEGRRKTDDKLSLATMFICMYSHNPAIYLDVVYGMIMLFYTIKGFVIIRH
jgi:hypothetical protein